MPWVDMLTSILQSDKGTVMAAKHIRAGVSLAVLPFLLLGVLAALPQQGPRLGFVDTDQVVRQMPGFAAADSTFRQEMAQWRAEFQPMQAALDSAVRVFDQESGLMSEAARATKMDELQQLSQQVQRRSNELSQRADERFSELMAPLQDRAVTVIDGIRAERGLSAVFETSTPGLISIEPTLDLTQVVIGRLRGTGQGPGSDSPR